MKRLRVGLFILISYLVLSGASVSALDAAPFEPTPKLPDSPVLIVAYSLTDSKPDYVELFNTSSQPIALAGWKLEISSSGETIVLANLSGWIAPTNYVIAADAAVVNNADFSYALDAGDITSPKTLRLVPPSIFAPHEVVVSSDGQYRRKVSTSTGNYLSTFETVASPTLYSGGFYTFPESTNIQFSEILANPRECSPAEAAYDCTDYVKIYNASSTPVDLSLFRLRIGYKGQASSPSNTYNLSGVVQPGHFMTINNSADGRAIGVTNSGGFVWLADIYGIMRYDSTVQPYEDASADSKKGQAWAYDASDDKWKWTIRPTPADAPSIFPTPVVKSLSAKVKIYTPCKVGQYRSKETNRCRTMASMTVASLKPCLASQFRSPETNRCRNLASASASSLKPCAANQERNPETNRCRKAASDIPKSAFAVEPVAEAGKAFAGWWALGGVGMFAVGYGIWEWRNEIVSGVRRAGTFFTTSK